MALTPEQESLCREMEGDADDAIFLAICILIGQASDRQRFEERLVAFIQQNHALEEVWRKAVT